jgi:hypothetical protein
MKYVIKNCDNYTELGKDWTCRSTIQNRKGCYVCQDCTDCVMKQIVELCKERSNKCERCKTFEDYQPTDCLSCGNDDVILANDILQLLDIEECE